MPKPKPTVYLDSTIPNHMYDARTDFTSIRKETETWWSDRSELTNIWISRYTLQEVRKGDYPHKRRAVEFTEKFDVLNHDSTIDEIVDHYIRVKLMQSSDPVDAYHLVYASFYSFDYLLSWNYKHIVNTNKRKHLSVENGRLGLRIPEICPPAELFP